MQRSQPTSKDFNFENPKYLPEISKYPYSPLNGSQVECDMKKPLKERVGSVVSHENNTKYSTHTIDLCVQAKICSESFRSEKAKHWEEKLGTAKQWAWIEGGVTALSVLGTAGAIAAQTIPYVAVAFGIASVVSMVLCGININRASETSRQIEGWKADPLEKLANERVRAYKEGFPYVFKNDLKLPHNSDTSNHQVLLPFEVEFLFERHFDAFCKKHLFKRISTEQEKKEWLDSFTNCNPVADQVLRYTSGAVPQKYSQVSSDYEVLHKQLTDIRCEFNKLRNKREKETTKVIKEINNNREAALLPFRAMLSHWNQQASKEHDKKLKETTDPKRIKEIEKEYSAAVTKYTLFYTAATIPVDFIFDKQVSEAENNLKSILKKIKKNEASSHAPYFGYARGLLDHARQVKEEPTFVYQPQFFSPELIFNIPAPSAPPMINNDFIQQAKDQRPQNFDDSNYKEFQSFLNYQQ